MAKDKKKKKDKKASSALGGIKNLSQNPFVADVVATALVATAAALKDTNKARRLAEEAGDELKALAKESGKRGSAMWQLALDVGRQALDNLTGEEPKTVKVKAKAKPAAAKNKAKPATAKTKAKPKAATLSAKPKRDARKKTN